MIRFVVVDKACRVWHGEALGPSRLARAIRRRRRTLDGPDFPDQCPVLFSELLEDGDARFPTASTIGELLEDFPE